MSDVHINKEKTEQRGDNREKGKDPERFGKKTSSKVNQIKEDIEKHLGDLKVGCRELGEDKSRGFWKLCKQKDRDASYWRSWIDNNLHRDFAIKQYEKCANDLETMKDKLDI